MIASEYRFHGQNGLMYVYRRGKTIRTKYCSVKFVTNNRSSSYRLAVVIAKKVAKSSPVRNRIRRRIYEQLRLLAPHFLTNQDVVLTVHDQALAVLDSKEIELLVKRILKTVNSESRHKSF